MSEMPWVRFFPSDWLAGTRGLSAAETGIYITLIATMYERGEPVPEDVSRLARRCGASVAAFRTALENLIEEGKIIRTDAGLWNDRVGKESEYRTEKSEVGRQAAAARWNKKDNKNKTSDDANAMQSQSERNANQKPEARSQKEDAAHLARVNDPAIAMQSALDPFNAKRWCDHVRASRRKPLSPATAEMHAAALREWRDLGGNPVEAVDLAIRKGWVTIEVEYLRNAGLSGAKASADPEIDWLSWCRAFARDGTWKDALGPKPGEPGCRAPPEIVEQARNHPTQPHKGERNAAA